MKIRNSRFVHEDAEGRSIYGTLGSMKGWLGILVIIINQIKTFMGLYSNEGGTGTANTAVAFHDGRLLALVESDHPYAVHMLADGQFETIGRHSYEGKLTHPMTAHPKLDADTNELLFFGYQLMKKPYCVYSVVNAQGKLVHQVDIDIPKAIMMHDFVITEKHSVFLDFPLEFEPKNMVKGSAFIFNPNRPTRFGVLGRHETKDKIRWFNFKPGFAFHSFNAWETVNEKGEIEISIIVCRSESINLDFPISEREVYPRPHYYRINLTTEETSEKRVSEVECEFPVIHPAFVGRRNQFAYCATFDSKQSNVFSGIVKFDQSDHRNGSIQEVGQILYGQNRFGGEAVYVPRKNGKSEDDGFLMTFIFDANSDKSHFVVFDAKTMSSKPLVRVVLPQRVPYGFHGLFIEEAKFQAQKATLP